MVNEDIEYSKPKGPIRKRPVTLVSQVLDLDHQTENVIGDYFFSNKNKRLTKLMSLIKDIIKTYL